MEVVEPIRDLEKLDRFLDYLRRKRQRDYVLAMVGCNTGLRIGDILQLQVLDVAGTHLVIRTKKTGRRVRVPLGGKIRRVLDAYTQTMDQHDFLFPSREGWNKPLTRARAYQILNEAARACAIPRIGTHSLRKTFGYHFYQATNDSALLMELLGHQDVAVTLRYVGINDQNIDQAMKGFSLGK